MTSDEIQKGSADWKGTWLKEIAYQLAVMNERSTKLESVQSSPWPGAIAQEFPANIGQALGSSVPAGSESAVRGGHQAAAIPAGLEPYCGWCRLLKRAWQTDPECPANPAGRTADERTTPLNPQTASIQPQKEP